MATPTFILPSAPTYTEGFVNGLNVYPNPTNFVANQVPFTRATTATRTNAAGLIELTPYNLFTYSENFLAWTKTSVSVTANTTTAPNGTLTADTLSVGIDPSPLRHRLVSADFTSQVIGTPYTGSFYLKANQHQWIQVIGNIGFSVGVWANFDLVNGVIGNTGGVDTTATITNVGNGWYRCTVSGVATATLTTGFEILTTNNTNSIRYPSYQSLVAQDVCYIWGAQLVEGTDALPYLLTETRLNRPRVDFSLGGCPNLLLEPQRTNVLQRSEEFNDAYWGKQSGATVVANTAVSPSGIQNADTVNLVSGSTISRIERAAISILANTYYTVSIYLKNISLTSGQTFQIRLETSGFDLRGTIDLFNKTNTVSITGTTVTGYVSGTQSASITELSNGWVRCNITVQSGTIAVGTGTFYIITNVDANRSFYAWGAQLEAGAYPTSYIPTQAASVTRNQDTFALSNVFTNNLISSAGGTWILDLRNNLSRVRDNGSGIFLYEVLGNNAIVILSPSGGGRYTIGIRNATATTFINTTNDNVKLAFKWNGSILNLFVNGVKNPTNFTFTALNFNNLDVTAGVPFNINSMALYNTPLSDDECIAKTL